MPLKLYFMKYFERKISQCILVLKTHIFTTNQSDLLKKNKPFAAFLSNIIPITQNCIGGTRLLKKKKSIGAIHMKLIHFGIPP